MLRFVEYPAPLELPLFGSPVEAGFPSPADDHIEGKLDLNEHLVRRPAATFFVRAAGESMRGAGIFDGDLLVIDRGITPQPDDIVIAVVHGDLRHLPEDNVVQIAEKRRRFAAWEADPKRHATKVACDLYIAAFLLPKKGGIPANANNVTVPTTSHLRTRLGGGEIFGALEAASVDAAGYARAFHWPLAFPEVMIGKGGFDVVLGNPPWERIKLQEVEFFASRDSDIACAPNAAARTKLIKALPTAILADGSPDLPRRQLYAAFEVAKRTAEASSVFFSSPKDEDPTKIDLSKVSKARRFPWTGRGDVNTYALFAENFLNLSNAAGSAGVIVPTGIATDATTAPFFGHLVTSKRLAGLVDFENSQPMFPGVHRSFKFTLLTLGSCVKEAEFAFFLTDPVQLEDPRRRFTLSPEQIAAINPNTKTAPVFRARANADLTASIYNRVPVLIEENRGEDGNPWRVSFMRMFDMSNDSHLFRTAEELKGEGLVRQGTDWVGENGRRYVPLFESKLFGFFNHRRTSYGDRDERGHRVLPEATLTQLQNSNYEPTVYYWVPESEFKSQLPKTRNSFCMFSNKVMGVSNERTMIVLPHYLAAGGDSVLYVFSDTPANLYSALIANFASLLNDFVVRNKTSGVNITFFFNSAAPYHSAISLFGNRPCLYRPPRFGAELH